MLCTHRRMLSIYLFVKTDKICADCQSVCDSYKKTLETKSMHENGTTYHVDEYSSNRKKNKQMNEITKKRANRICTTHIFDLTSMKCAKKVQLMAKNFEYNIIYGSTICIYLYLSLSI